MKIGIDARFFRRSTGGNGRYTRNLLKYILLADKNDQFIVFLTPADRQEFDLKAENLKKRVVDIDHYSLKEQSHLPSVIKREKLDLIHFTNFNHPIFYRGPFIVTIHDLTMVLYPAKGRQISPLHRLPFVTVFKNALRRSSKIITPSKSTADDLYKYFGTDPEKIIVIPEGIEPYFRPVDSKAIKSKEIELQHRLGIERPYLLFVSQWRPHKGIGELLDAFELVTKRYKIPVNLVLVGSPNPNFPQITTKVEKIVAKAKKWRIFTPGFVEEEDLLLLYQLADAFVLPSFYEGFGLPILEAMASGVPVICSKNSSLPEVAGDAVQYCDPYRYPTIAKAIAQVLTNKQLSNKLKAEGLKRCKQFTWSKCAQKTLEVYKEIPMSKSK